MLTFLKQYNQRLQHQHGWEVELDCPACGNHGLPDYTGWTPNSNIHFRTRHTIFANACCPRCGQGLKQQAGEKLTELFAPMPTPSPSRNRRLSALLISLLVGLPLPCQHHDSLLQRCQRVGVSRGWLVSGKQRQPVASGRLQEAKSLGSARHA